MKIAPFPDPTRHQSAHPIWGIILLLYGLVNLAATPATIMMALIGQMYYGNPEYKPIGLQILGISLWLLPISCITSGIIGLAASVLIFARSRVPAMFYKLLIGFFLLSLIIFLLWSRGG